MTTNEQLSELQRILSHDLLNTLFQPIVSLSCRRIHGYGALSPGPPNSPPGPAK